MNKVLIIPPNWVGDAILATAAVRWIKEEHPDAQVSVLCVPRVAPVFRCNPDVAEVIENIEEGKGVPARFIYWFGLVPKLGRKDFDAVFLLHRSRSRAIWMYLAGIPLRVGFANKGRGMFLSHAVAPPPANLHRVKAWELLLQAVGWEGSIPMPLMAAGTKARAWAQRRLGKKRCAILHPGGNWPPKRWPADRFARLADILRDNFGLDVAITGSIEDKPLAGAIAAASRYPLRDLTGKTNLEELAACLATAKICISNDSAPMHLAAAIGTPLVALFGPTSPAITGPVGDGPMRVLHKDIGLPVPNPDPMCRDMRYMEAISVLDAAGAVEELIGSPVPVG